MVDFLASQDLSEIEKLWNSSKSFSLSEKFSSINTRLNLEEYSNHIWLSSSGSHNPKLIALSRNALLTSAASVNQWYKVTPSDCWALALPLSHIAGFSIFVRSQVTQFRIAHFKERWQCFQFCNFLAKEKCTLASLVPTQLFDLVSKELSPPPWLRAVIVGGAELSKSLYLRAKQLGWPIVPSYGLTECSSGVASAEINCEQGHFPNLMVLPHVRVETDSSNRLTLRSAALLSAIIHLGENLHVERFENVYRTEDLAQVSEHDGKQILELIGRADRQVKIKGSFVSLDQLEAVVQELLQQKGLQVLSAISCKDNSRDGLELVLHVSAGSTLKNYLEELNFKIKEHSKVQIADIVEHLSFPLLSNGKVNYKALV